MNSYRTHARLSGVFFLTAFVGGITGFAFLGPVLDHPIDLREVADQDTAVLIGALGIVLMSCSTALITIPMFPVLRKKNEGMALAAVVFRTIESMVYVMSVVCYLAIIKLGQMYVETETPDPSYQIFGDTLQSITENNFQIFFFVIGAFMYYYLFFQTKLVPKWLATWGLIGIACNLLNFFFVLFDVYGSESTIAMLSELPLATNELVLAFWLIIRGYNQDSLKVLEGP
jgi:hypothetical protein